MHPTYHHTLLSTTEYNYTTIKITSAIVVTRQENPYPDANLYLKGSGAVRNQDIRTATGITIRRNARSATLILTESSVGEPLGLFGTGNEPDKFFGYRGFLGVNHDARTVAGDHL